MYPKTFVHRHNQHATVVVANPEQEAELPKDFILHATHGAAPSPADELEKLKQERDALAADRALLDKERAEFNALQEHASTELSAIADELEGERKKLADGLAQLAADRAAHDSDRAAWEAQKNSAQPPGTGEKSGESAIAEGAATGETGTASAAPAKRTRARAEG